MGNPNKKATREEMACVLRVIKEAFPDLVRLFGSHGNCGGHRAPADIRNGDITIDRRRRRITMPPR